MTTRCITTYKLTMASQTHAAHQTSPMQVLGVPEQSFGDCTPTRTAHCNIHTTVCYLHEYFSKWFIYIYRITVSFHIALYKKYKTCKRTHTCGDHLLIAQTTYCTAHCHCLLFSLLVCFFFFQLENLHTLLKLNSFFW